jgi:hypothetical protein
MRKELQRNVVTEFKKPVTEIYGVLGGPELKFGYPYCGIE